MVRTDLESSYLDVGAQFTDGAHNRKEFPIFHGIELLGACYRFIPEIQRGTRVWVRTVLLLKYCSLDGIGLLILVDNVRVVPFGQLEYCMFNNRCFEGFEGLSFYFRRNFRIRLAYFL